MTKFILSCNPKKQSNYLLKQNNSAFVIIRNQQDKTRQVRVNQD